MRVTLVCHASTSAVRTASFPADEPLDRHGRVQTERMAGTTARTDDVRCAPSQRCRQTVEALGLVAAVDPGLAGCDHGNWTGRSLAEVGSADPIGLTSWLSDPQFRGHGGESLADLMVRVGIWLDERTDPPHSVLAVCDAAVIRAAVAHVLHATPRSVWRIDVAPLSTTLLVGEPGRWSLRGLHSG